MSTFSKKLVSISLTATTAVWASGALLLFPVANAQATDLNAQIQSLLAQIAQLQAQLGTSQGGSMSFSFTHDLTVGSTGSDVKSLQEFLNSHGAQVSATGAGSPGNESMYFGAKTQAAVAVWQAAHGITPTAGYFGPKTRAAVNAMFAVTPPPASGDMCLNLAGVQATTPAGYARDAFGNCVVSVVVPTSGLVVGLASDTPNAGSLISSAASAAARTPVLAINLTAGNSSGITVSELKFNKIGVLSDSSVSGAYLVQNGRVIAQYNSINQGVIDFSGLMLNVAAGQTQKVWLAIDVATGLSAGNTVGFGVMSASNITAWDANNALVTAQGNFPLNGNTFTVTSVSNPSLATLVTASSSIGSSVTAGTNNNLVGAWNFTVGNNRVKLSSLNFRVIGSATKTDIRNVKLTLNGTQIGNTLPQVDPSGIAYFDMTSNPAILNTGSNNIQIWADIAGSPSYDLRFEILNSYDIYAIDTQYNVPISPTVVGGVGTDVTILSGTITVSQASNTPTGNLAPGQSGVTLAKFTIYAAGEAVKVKWLGVGLNITGLTNGSMDSAFGNLTLVDDAGGQVGTTINTLSTSVTCTDTAFSNTSSSYRNCFGNSSSPINYIVPANTTRVLSLIVDVKSTAAFSNVTGILTGNTSNLQGLTSASVASSGSVNGSALSLAATSLTVAKNSSIGTVTLSGGASNRKIGSYAFSASSAEGVKVNNLSVQSNSGSLNNMRVMVGSMQFGSTQGSVASGTVYSFSGTPFNVPSGQTTYVDIFADTISGSTGVQSPATVLTGCSASGLISFSSISCSSTNGQGISFAGNPTLAVTMDAQPSNFLVMGATGNTLATFRFAETSNVEDVKVTDLNVFQQVASVTSTKSGFGNVSLYKADGTLLGTAGSANTSANTSLNASTTASGPNGYYYQFHFATPVIVPQLNSLVLTLKGDANSFVSSQASDNTTSIFKIATSTDSVNNTTALAVVALGNTSNNSSTVTLSTTNAPTKTLLRTKLNFATTPGASPIGALGRGGVTELGRLIFTADAFGAATLNSVTVTFSGYSASSPTFLDGVTLVDNDVPATNLGTGNVTSSVCTTTGTCTKSFILGATINGLTVSAGATKTLILKYNGTTLNPATANIGGSLTATINALTGIVYTDGTESSAVSGITLEPTISVPVTIGSQTSGIGL